MRSQGGGRRRLFHRSTLARSFKGAFDRRGVVFSSSLSRQSDIPSQNSTAVARQEGKATGEHAAVSRLSSTRLDLREGERAKEQNKRGAAARAPSPPRPDVFEATRSLRGAA